MAEDEEEFDGELMTDADLEAALDSLQYETDTDMAELLKAMNENQLISWEEAERIMGDMDDTPVKSSLPPQTRPTEPENDTNVEDTIRKLLANDPKLTQINLNNMKRTPIPQIKRIIEATRENTYIERLCLANMGLYDHDIGNLIDVLEVNESLKHINLETNYLGGDYFARLLRAALNNMTLEELKAVNQGVSFPTEKEKEIIKAIQENRGILKVSINLRLPEGRHKIEHALIRNQEIRRALRKQEREAAAAAAAAAAAEAPVERPPSPKKEPVKPKPVERRPSPKKAPVVPKVAPPPAPAPAPAPVVAPVPKPVPKPEPKVLPKPLPKTAFAIAKPPTPEPPKELVKEARKVYRKQSMSFIHEPTTASTAEPPTLPGKKPIGVFPRSKLSSTSDDNAAKASPAVSLKGKTDSSDAEKPVENGENGTAPPKKKIIKKKVIVKKIVKKKKPAATDAGAGAEPKTNGDDAKASVTEPSGSEAATESERDEPAPSAPEPPKPKRGPPPVPAKTARALAAASRFGS